MREIKLNQLKNKKCALVLSGGVVRAAAWHLGVALALDELGFSFKSNNSDPLKKRSLEISTYVGSSAGALICVYLASGFSAKEVLDSIMAVPKSKLKSISYRDMFSFKPASLKPSKSDIYHPSNEYPFFLRKIVKPFMNISGLFTTEGLRRYLEEHVITSKDFDEYEADLFIVGTQLDHSRKVIFSKYNYPSPPNDPLTNYYTGTSISEACAASMSVPPVYSPYPIENKLRGQVEYYIDGEIRDTLSTHVAADNKCDYIISSWTHTPYHYIDAIGSLVNYGLPAICVQSIYLMIQRKIVNHRNHREMARDVLETVNTYMKSENISDDHRKDLMNILERKLNYNSKIKLIDIYPDHDDYKFFFSSFFSLNPKSSGYAVEQGYKKTIQVFQNLTWS